MTEEMEVDLGKAPFVHKVGLTVHSHVGEGSFVWDATKVRLHREGEQMRGDFINGLALK